MDKMLQYLAFAKAQYDLALLSIPDSIQTLFRLGQVEHLLAYHWDEQDAKRKIDYYQQSVNHYSQALTLLKIKSTENIKSSANKSSGNNNNMASNKNDNNNNNSNKNKLRLSAVQRSNKLSVVQRMQQVKRAQRELRNTCSEQLAQVLCDW